MMHHRVLDTGERATNKTEIQGGMSGGGGQGEIHQMKEVC